MANLRILQSLVLLLLSTYALAASLGITKDNTPNDAYKHWSSARPFPGSHAEIAAQLPALAKQAYDEMIVDATKDNIGRKNRPATMAAFAVGTTVYFSSALKGGGSFLLEIGEPRDPTTPSPITDDAAGVLGQAILRCQNQYGTDHINDVKCAEPLAIQAYLVNNQDSKPFPELETSISTYGGKSGRNLQIMDPCQKDPRFNEGDWGCTELLHELDISVVGKDGDQPGAPTIEPSGERLPNCFWPSTKS